MSKPPSANGVDRPATHRFSPPPAPDGTEGHSPSTGQPFLNGENNGHDSKGRFTKGNSGGPGRPANGFARQVAALRRAALAVLTESEVRVVVEALLKKARGGDVASARIVLAYAVGRPAAPADPDALDFDELRLYEKAIEAMLPLPSMVNALPPDVVCGIVQAVRPHITADTAKEIVEQLKSGNVE
jgi:hypothetical protein